MKDIEGTKYLRELRRNMIQHFNADEISLLAYDLGVDWEDLAGIPGHMNVDTFGTSDLARSEPEKQPAWSPQQTGGKF